MVVDCLERMNVGILFMVGGDGTLMASKKIADEILKRDHGVSISVPAGYDMGMDSTNFACP